MAAKLGPSFALKASLIECWTAPLTANDAECVVQTEFGQAYVLEIFSQQFRNYLFQDRSPRWIFLAQVLKEDEESLFAFATPLERKVFISLKELPSIGPKKAATLMGALGIEGLKSLLYGENPRAFKVPGIGPKTLAQISQGLQNNKKKFLPLLESVDMPVVPEAYSSDSASAAAVSQKITSTQVQTPSEGPKPSASTRARLSPALLKGVERLGLSSDEAFYVYQKLLEQGDSLEGLDSAQLLSKILKKWGELNSVAPKVRPVL